MILSTYKYAIRTIRSRASFGGLRDRGDIYFWRNWCATASDTCDSSDRLTLETGLTIEFDYIKKRIDKIYYKDTDK